MRTRWWLESLIYKNGHVTFISTDETYQQLSKSLIQILCRLCIVEEFFIYIMNVSINCDTFVYDTDIKPVVW